MIHVFDYNEQLFDAVASGAKSFMVLNPGLDILPGDFMAINETHEYIDHFHNENDEWEEKFSELTGRCCMVEVVYIEMTENNAAAIASIRPCDVATMSQRINTVTVRNLYEVQTYNRKGEK